MIDKLTELYKAGKLNGPMFNEALEKVAMLEVKKLAADEGPSMAEAIAGAAGAGAATMDAMGKQGSNKTNRSMLGELADMAKKQMKEIIGIKKETNTMKKVIGDIQRQGSAMKVPGFGSGVAGNNLLQAVNQ